MFDAGDPLRPLLHVGIPKSGSTWLQLEHWDKHPGVERVIQVHDVVDKFLQPEDDEFIASDAGDRLLAAVEAARENGRLPIISCEGLGRRLGRPRKTQRAMKRIMSIVPGCKVLVVLRNQYTLLPAEWQQEVRHAGEIASYEHFVRGPAKPVGRVGIGLRRCYDFDGSLAFLESKIPSQDLNVGLFEDFNADPEAFRRAIDSWLGLDPDAVSPRARTRVHPGLSLSSVNLLRHANRFSNGGGASRRLEGVLAAADARRDRRPVSRDDRIVGRYRHWIRDAFAEGNRAVQARYGHLAMAAHGYPGWDSINGGGDP